MNIVYSIPTYLLKIDYNYTIFRIKKKNTMCAVDGAKNYEKSFVLFGPTQVDEKNKITIGELRHEFMKDGREEDFFELENSFRESASNAGLSEEQIQSELLSLEDIWKDTDDTLPRRIRCFVHLLVLVPKIDFKNTTRQWRLFWSLILHAVFKSKFSLINFIFLYCILKCILLLLFLEMLRSFFALATALWNKQSRSVPLADIIKEILGKYLIIPNDTRWNAEFDALVDLQKHTPKLNEVMEELSLPRFTPDHFTFLTEYIQVTKPVAISIDILQGNSATLGFVLPSIVKLQKHLKNIIDGNSLKYCIPLAKFILWNLNDRTSHWFSDKDYILGKHLY